MIYLDGLQYGTIKNNIFNLTAQVLTDNDYGIVIQESKSINITIEDNIFYNIGGVSNNGNNHNMTIRKNNLTSLDSSVKVIAFYNVDAIDSNILIENNIIIGERISGSNVSDITIRNNRIYNDSYYNAIAFTQESYNIIIENNYINLTDCGISIHNSTYVNISNNTIDSITTGYDALFCWYENRI